MTKAGSRSSEMNRIYLDHNATTAPSSVVREHIGEWLESWGNPSSIHWSGRGPKALLRDARRSLGALLNCDPLEIIFTSGGSESNNLAIKGIHQALALGRMRQIGGLRNRYILSSVEHPSVMKPMLQLKSLGADVQFVPVDRDGKIDLDVYQSLLSPQTAMVSVMFANNETGHIFPIQKMAEMAHQVGALFHCDGVQALGKVAVNLKEWGVDLATFSGHKFYALKGVGLLYARRGLNLESLIAGGGQERGRRAGTENLLAIASIGAMAGLGAEILEKSRRMEELRNELESLISSRISGVHLTGAQYPRIANTSSMVIDGVDGETLLMNLDMRGFSVSTGAACSAGSSEPSPVLLAMGLSRREAQSSLRVSLGWETTREEIHLFVDALDQVVARLRSFRHGEEAMLGI